MKKIKVRWRLFLYDTLLFLLSGGALALLYTADREIFNTDALVNLLIAIVSLAICGIFARVYQQVWRYGGTKCYIKMAVAYVCAFIISTSLTHLLDMLSVIKALPLHMSVTYYSISFIVAMLMRMTYRYIYKSANTFTKFGRFAGGVLHVIAGLSVHEKSITPNKIKVAIIGAGRVGVSLAEEMLSSAMSKYTPGCFIDNNKSKSDRTIHGIPVYFEDEYAFIRLKESDIREVVIAIPDLPESEKKRIHDRYSEVGYKVKVYDYPVMQSSGGKRYLREFDIEELLFRKPVSFNDPETEAYYRDKVILITGGGGSIGSELCRQLAKMKPKQIVVLDIYENGAYDIQQELKIAYKGELNIVIEIASITNRRAMKQVFEEYRPDIVINAAAHKHVPLMEHNCVEAVENNVFGTKNLVELCEEYGTPRFMMVSTDKAVNPTNVMGATKRMCEMIVQSASTVGATKYSATRFGNVLGSAGSVIPLFKKQIASGGPITLTDKRIIRYFMTIPEASQLVLQSGAMAKNGELFVLDMGQPIKILDLAENMIRLSGVKDIEIVETGLRPGEKLYEELLVKTDELDKTANKMIFVERETPPSFDEVREKLEILSEACESGNDDVVRAALKRTVPTYKTMEEVNASAEESKEMKDAKEIVSV